MIEKEAYPVCPTRQSGFNWPRLEEINKSQVLDPEFCETHLNLDAENKFYTESEGQVYPS